MKVTEVKGKEKLVFTVDSLKVVDAKDKQSNSDVTRFGLNEACQNI